MPRLPSADAHVGQQYYLDGVEQSGAGMCALGDPGSGIPAYCTAAGWAADSGVLDTVLRAGKVHPWPRSQAPLLVPNTHMQQI